ncbi:Cell wall alpha-1,3-glucan synthase ags1 [Coniosporium apollinis]|uniref:alpha-1,3-glucan synthase n=1 Tax=Coniosporium apollinis TaxID=61459 RepID=A0ABQ9NHS0_9PEZI|nr:Cell wall alpha-1,3-glucan synthase ags1 [Coniosporium apollinis]
MRLLVASLLGLLAALVSCLKFDLDEIQYNLNENFTATNPLDYWGEWNGHNYTPSPQNWRFPFYTLFLDRFVNGDPSNDDINGTFFEHDVLGTQMRHGGDLVGLTDTLDYIQGMEIKCIYIAGLPFINFPWKSDQYSPLDLTLLDKHFGDIRSWRSAIDEIHRRGMMADLIGFEGFLNDTAPFDEKEYEAVLKSDRHYSDFAFGNTYKSTCQYPSFWNDSGFPVRAQDDANFSQLVGCYDSEFNQYGDAASFAAFPDWQRQLAKFASVQDRLREWIPSVREKIERFTCITIAQLDIDGFRFDKVGQVTVDAGAEFAANIRQCAQRFNKDNFFMPGEISGGNNFASIYFGRGRQPDQLPENSSVAVALNNTSDDKYFLRTGGKNAFDAAAFHYSIYRSLTQFLGLDGNLTATFDLPVNFVDAWNHMLLTNDFVNAFTGEFDPRHMYGTTNQDNFRWPMIAHGTEKMLLGQFVTTLQMPGIPILLWGEEQAFYITDSTANNYLFGRQAMSSSVAWQSHGCYRLGAEKYNNFPVDQGLNGCNDDSVSLDHRDPSHPVRNIIKHMYYLRRIFPILNDGYLLQSLSNQTHQIFLPGSNGTATEAGMWSVMRDKNTNVQALAGSPVWLIYQNENQTINYTFDCSSNETALISPFDEGTTVKNLLAPFEELDLRTSAFMLGVNGSVGFNGCLDSLQLGAWDFKAFVPKDQWVAPPPMTTKFLPGHDARIVSTVAADGQESIDIEIQFSQEMDCNSVTQNLLIDSTTEDRTAAQLDNTTVVCGIISNPDPPLYTAGITSAWSWKATLVSVSNGVHEITVQNATTADGTASLNSIDHFMIRNGQPDNPVVFPRVANYSREVLFKDSEGVISVSHKAAGADQWRYSLNWGSSWSNWTAYDGGNSTLPKQPWSGTKAQMWDGDHVILQYFSRKTGSSNYIQHGDANWASKPLRRFPHLFAHGPFNKFGIDTGIKNNFKLQSNNHWQFHLMTEWPSEIQVNVWGTNPDGQPDQTYVLGDIDDDSVLDRMPPDSSVKPTVNISALPPPPHLAYRMELNDADLRFKLVLVGSRLHQMLLFAILWTVPVLIATVSVWTYMGAFYGVKFNKIGILQKKDFRPLAFRHKFKKLDDDDKDGDARLRSGPLPGMSLRNLSTTAIPALAFEHKARRTVLIATVEYDIEDWAIKIKIGGLGVMAQLMGKNLAHQDLIWVVPCVGGIDYPVDQPAEPITVTILGSPYSVQVQYHRLRNITYVLLDAPVFRQQSKSDPYPPRMDDLDSAVYYSAWNACIAETIKRFPIDIYHINDYHGAAAPLYLLPDTIPCCLSLHNAEFQGLWPMRTPEERDEVCRVYNLDRSIVENNVQFGEVFNLLHAGASYLRLHQKGFGAVGVSDKYGPRSYARYPIFWGLKSIGKLPNPDPSDTDPWDKDAEANQVITVDPAYEASRGDLRRQAQEWAQLDVNPNAELFVFVGRWSSQKGVDLIADVFPAILEKHADVQLICIGPVIDLYGKFAALKLGVMMKKYPRRVFSKPEFTALPPCIFTGAEFALIPSRDEPFGLVAVEFGRKGALGVGARVGGLGQMPGWWFSVESITTKHLLHQLKSAIEEALASKTEVRAMMRARSAKQRFPVAKWVKDLETLQSTSIRIHWGEASRDKRGPRGASPSPDRRSGVLNRHCRDISSDRLSLYEEGSDGNGRSPSPVRSGISGGLHRSFSLGVRAGPGHQGSLRRHRRMSGIDESDQRDEREEEVTITQDEAEASMREEQRSQPIRQIDGHREDIWTPPQPHEVLLEQRGRSRSRNPRTPRISLFAAPEDEMAARSRSPAVRDSLLPSDIRRHRASSASALSLDHVTMGRKDYNLQKIDPTFSDTTGKYYEAFEDMLQKLDGKTSETDLVIEEYLVESEKAWFKRFREAKLGRSRDPSPAALLKRESSPYGRAYAQPADDSDDNESVGVGSVMDEFLLGQNYQRPSTFKRWLQTRIGDWPIYSLLLALGQILAANSYQITLLTSGQTAEKMYIIGAVYIITSCLWWILFRMMKPIYVLSVPFFFYGLAFFMVGVAPFLGAGAGRDWIRNVATGSYATASSSGSIFFALNFGDEGGAPIKSWVYRATIVNDLEKFLRISGEGPPVYFRRPKTFASNLCIIQGTQQLYVTALFYWGSTMTVATAAGYVEKNTLTSKPIMAAITMPIGALLWIIGLMLFTSLPSYYRQTPGKIPSFYHSLLRRKLILWFFVAVILQNYFLSAPYGRNWSYLWSSKYAPHWAVTLLVFAFFIGVWAGLLAVFARLSKAHSWILPIFAIGLGAPRWAQIWWGTSSFGLWLPWMPGGPVGSALAGRSLWLWLGVLDAVQGVGIGMLLLQTLTRIHIAVTLIAAQLLGSVVTLIATATAPDRNGPEDVFPDLSAGIVPAMSKPWFWIALACQLIIPVGFFKFFRKEQLSKP